MSICSSSRLSRSIHFPAPYLPAPTSPKPRTQDSHGFHPTSKSQASHPPAPREQGFLRLVSPSPLQGSSPLPLHPPPTPTRGKNENKNKQLHARAPDFPTLGPGSQSRLWRARSGGTPPPPLSPAAQNSYPCPCLPRPSLAPPPHGKHPKKGQKRNFSVKLAHKGREESPPGEGEEKGGRPRKLRENGGG